jgi:hypothetical protein
MRSPPTFSDASASLSFFLTTPAKKPRTECCCQSVAFMIAGTVVPLALPSIASTVACFDEKAFGSLDVADFDGAEVFEPAPFDRTALCFFAGRFAGEEVLQAVFAGFDFDLVAAIWLSRGINDSIKCCH